MGAPPIRLRCTKTAPPTSQVAIAKRYKNVPKRARGAAQRHQRMSTTARIPVPCPTYGQADAIQRSGVASRLACAAVLTAAAKIRLLAADVPQTQGAQADPAQQFMQQPRWRSTNDQAYIAATVVDVAEHIAQVVACHAAGDHPRGLLQEMQLSTSTLGAVRKVAELGADASAWRTAAMESLQEISDSLRQTSAEIIREEAPAHLRCSHRPPIHVAMVQACTLALGLSDRDLAVDLVLGAPCVGNIPATGNWRPKEEPATLGLNAEYCTRWNLELDASVRGRTRTADSEACWAATIAELDEGWIDGPWSFADMELQFGTGRWCGIRRFPVIQANGVRPCDDAAESGHNWATWMHETIQCVGPDWLVRVASEFVRLLGWSSEWHMEASVDDITKAYRTFPCSQPQFTVFAMQNPATGQTAYFTLPGFNFGLKSAVVQFNRLPFCATAILQRCLACPTCHYVDDVPTAEPDIAHGTQGEEGLFEGSAQACAWMVYQDLGFPLSLKKRKLLATSQKFLGVITCFDELWPEGHITMTVSKERLAALTAAIVAILAAGSLHAGAAAKLAGKLVFVTSWGFGRFGRAALSPIFEHIRKSRSHGGRLDAAANGALKFFQHILPHFPARTFVMRGWRRPRAYVWTDACWEIGSDRPAGLGIVVYLPGFYTKCGKWVAHRWLYAEGNTPSAFIAQFQVRSQYIGQLELLAAVAAYHTFPRELADREVIHWIDNTSALASLIKGYSRAQDSASIVHAFHAFNLGLRATAWFEYVRSEANIADMPSRGEFEYLHSLGAKSSPLVLPLLDSWSRTASEWIAQAQTAIGTNRQAQGEARAETRRHPVPTTSEASEAAEPARRGRRRTRAIRRHVPAVIVGQLAHESPKEAIIDCTQEGESPGLSNPFKMGRNGADEALRRLAISMHAEWIKARSVPAWEIRTPDGYRCPAEVAPSETSPRGHPASGWTGEQAIACLEAEAMTRCDLPSIALECFPHCDHRLCHTTVLAAELRTILQNPRASPSSSDEA